METKIGESHPSDTEKSLWLHCIENHREKATGNAGKSSREEEIFCKSTWAEKEPLRWRQGRTQIGAFWILGRQKKTRACKEPLGCQCQCWHLELKVLRIPTHTHSHWSVWWLRLSTAERAEQGRRARGSQPALQEEQSQLDLGRDFHLWQQCSTWMDSPQEGLWWVSQPELQLLFALQSPEGLNPPPTCRGRLTEWNHGACSWCFTEMNGVERFTPFC